MLKTATVRETPGSEILAKDAISSQHTPWGLTVYSSASIGRDFLKE